MSIFETKFYGRSKKVWGSNGKISYLMIGDFKRNRQPGGTSWFVNKFIFGNDNRWKWMTNKEWGKFYRERIRFRHMHSQIFSQRK